MDEILPRIRELSEEVAAAHEAFVVDFRLRGKLQGKVLELFVDTDVGITADRCAAISRDLSARLDHENFSSGRYQLVVSSPGLDRPLKLHRQYRKNVGKNLKVRFRRLEEVKTVVGRVREVTDRRIVLQEKGTWKEIPISFDSIEESKVEIEWGSERK